MTKLREADAANDETPIARKSRRPRGADADWVAVRTDYVEGGLSVTQIVEKHKTTRTLLYARAEFEGWPRRSAGERPRGRVGIAQPIPAPAAGRSRKQAIAARLMNVIEKQLKQMEADMAEEIDGPLSPADNERRARTVANLTRSLDQATELEVDERSKRGGGGAPEQAGRAEAVRLRRELAERLKKLGETLHGGGDRGDA